MCGPQPARTPALSATPTRRLPRRLNNLRFSGVVRPLAVFYAHSPDHVEAAVKCGRQWDVPISPAGGRHNYQGLALVTGGLTIDMSNLTKVRGPSGGGGAHRTPRRPQQGMLRRLLWWWRAAA